MEITYRWLGSLRREKFDCWIFCEVTIGGEIVYCWWWQSSYLYNGLPFSSTWSDQFIFTNKWLHTIPIIQPLKIVSTEGKQFEFWGCFEIGNYFLPGNTKTQWVNFLQKSILHSTTLQAEILQNSQEVEFINHHLQAVILENSQ